ncbi:MAG: tRNA preQ1(34) S-adenosylmethionine ribosyltransferase-isomerase QueA [Phycisphaerae bacterium]|nr:tRNA preQ1(34) S-adenosylmethionine ribosyltransferase-isomerase QueA [Phycisphaerae bacterium]
MRTSDLDYPFDPSLVARAPVTPRDAARLLVYRRATKAIEHRIVRDLPQYLERGDALVVNDTSVARARVKLQRAHGGARIEGLLLERRDARTWIALLRNAKRVDPGERLDMIGPATAARPGAFGLIVHGREGEGFVVSIDGGVTADAVLAEVGWTPLPPYILKARKDDGGDDDGGGDANDRVRYQTVFAADTDAPSVAAPTAGLHFTEQLLAAIAARGIERIPLTLQVGAGTFKPIEADELSEHRMHRERCMITHAALAQLRSAHERSRRGAGRVVAVGTTSVRTLESLPSPLPLNGPLVWDTDILIAPGSSLRLTDALLTNFHLPRSTLIALVAAFIGIDELKRIYAIAISERYRFYSYGDAMLVV